MNNACTYSLIARRQYRLCVSSRSDGHPWEADEFEVHATCTSAFPHRFNAPNRCAQAAPAVMDARALPVRARFLGTDVSLNAAVAS